MTSPISYNRKVQARRERAALAQRCKATAKPLDWRWVALVIMAAGLVFVSVVAL